MIPFEEEPSLTASEEYAQELLKANWDNVERTTPGRLEDIEERYSDLAQEISRNIQEDTGVEVSNLFRPGVPDFIAFNDTGEYKFVEVKSGDDGIRASQLRWLRDFEGVNAEIWFTKPGEVENKIETENFKAYTFQDVKGENSQNRIIVEKDSNYLVELPKNLASILDLSEDDSVAWRLKSKNELILDTR